MILPQPSPDLTHPAAAGPRRLAGRLWHAPYLLLALAALFWSGNVVVGRAVYADIPPVTLAALRWGLAFCVVLGFALRHLRRDLPELLRRWRIVLVLSFFGIAVFNTMIYAALHDTTAINTLLLQSTMPLIIVLCSFLLFGERPTPRQLLALAISLLGAVVIAARASAATLLALTINPGDAVVLLAVACYALYSALLRRRPSVHPLSFVAASFAIGTLMLLPLLAWEHAAGAPIHLGGGALLAVLYVALFPSLLAYLCFNRGIELIGANRAGQLLHLMPFFGSVLAIAFLGEAFHLYHAAGIALIGAGIALATIGRRR